MLRKKNSKLLNVHITDITYYIYSFVKKAKKVAEKLPAVAKALHPTVGTVKPSARLGKVGVKTGVPIFMAVAKLGHLSGSTPYK